MNRHVHCCSALVLVGLVAIPAGSAAQGANEPAPAVAEASALIDSGRYDEAKALLDQLGAEAAGAEALRCLARLAEVNGDPEAALARAAEAVAACRKEIRSVDSIEGANALAEYHTAFGRVALRAGAIDQAEEQFRAAIALINGAHQKLHELGVPHNETDPRLFAGPATDGLARVYAARGDAHRAERTWRGVAARTDDPAILVAFGDLYTSIDDARKADRMYARAAELAGDRPEHRRALALHLADRGSDLDRALALAEAALEGRDDIEGHDALAWVLHRRGEHDRAAEAIARALRTGTRDPSIRHHAGMIALALGRRDEARDHLATALEANPKFDPLDAPLAREALDSLK
ncbi:tetratricopeptide repeat protein [Tautonia sociabilis]|uniref:Tetratricopeptide repeat protein n=1 Tax=Tautonia sociabilis TaxID=2080755 RepID=A0A432MDK4_9BACT|nr:tetratricopeptide repeat protein [Tautonia sociabilis]RUL82809.1 tetratricopeptide repeat protein [Tautonia sociabilis]